ncbi:unnamed protein product [Rotaria sp. Silwood1]|nr:unnamed protein product [Rotaria sp. Silwood1]
MPHHWSIGFFQGDTCTYVHNLFDLIHHTSVASHLFVCEGIHLDESGLLLVLLIEQFLPLPYISVLRLVELIVYDRIEMTFDAHLSKLFYPIVGLKLEEFIGRLEIAYHLITNEKFHSILLSVSLFIIESCQFILESQP